MKNIVFTYKMPCTHMKVINVMPMSFCVTLDLNKEKNRLEINFSEEVDTECITAYVDIEPENMWPLCYLDWWCGIQKYNLGREILDIISSTLSEHLSGNTDDYGDSQAEVDLNIFEYEWRESINELLANIIREEEKEEKEQKSDEETPSNDDLGIRR